MSTQWDAMHRVLKFIERSVESNPAASNPRLDENTRVFEVWLLGETRRAIDRLAEAAGQLPEIYRPLVEAQISALTRAIMETDRET